MIYFAHLLDINLNFSIFRPLNCRFLQKVFNDKCKVDKEFKVFKLLIEMFHSICKNRESYHKCRVDTTGRIQCLQNKILPNFTSEFRRSTGSTGTFVFTLGVATLK